MTHLHDVRSITAEVMNNVLIDSGRTSREFSDEDHLTDTIGLESLDLAVVVVVLEQVLGTDPFRTGTPRVATFGDLIRAFEDALDSHDE